MGGIFAPAKEQAKREAEEYIYLNEDGGNHHKVLRYHTNAGKKAFAQWHWAKGGWVKGLPKGFEPVPYRLPAVNNYGFVLIVEGEKDCETAKQSGLEQILGCITTTNPGGAGKWPVDWGQKYFYGKSVVIVPDNDQPGIDHAKRLYTTVVDHAAEVIILQLPGIGDKGDLSDYLALPGGGVKNFAKLVWDALKDPEKHKLDQCGIEAKPEEPPAPPPPEKPALARRFDAVKRIVGDNLRLNLLTKEIELDGEPLNRDNLIIRLACDYRVNVPDNHADKITGAIAKIYAYHPVRDYLDSVTKTHGNDTTILDDLAHQYLGTDNPLHQTFLRKWLISCVARIYKPGCKLDTALILQGKQGVRKSTFFKTLASQRWFDDSMGNASDRDERLKMHMVWIIEWAELEAVFKRKDVSVVKSFLTTTTDLIRAPYERTTSRYARQCVIVGTTNEQDFLADSTGNRRFWVIPVTTEIDTDQLTAARDQIWAAAVAAFNAGEPWYLSREDSKQAEDAAADYQVTDPWLEVIDKYLEPFNEVSMQEVLKDALKIPIDRFDRAAEMRVGRCMRQLNWEVRVKKIDGKCVRRWERQ
jgi:predicted P-loop ATPase